MRTSCGSAGRRSTQFVVAHDGDQAGRRIGQRQGAVIEPRAAAQPDARAIDRECGHQDHRCVRRPRRPPATARAGSRSPNRASTSSPGRYSPHCSGCGITCGVAARDRQQHPHAAAMQRVDQLDRAGLGPDRHVGADGFGLGDQRRQVVGPAPAPRRRAPAVTAPRRASSIAARSSAFVRCTAPPPNTGPWRGSTDLRTLVCER